ncbi:MAG: (E)-4-hydroxy-3-methylbut-2-enyl-diphosphate synthase [Verrucomicrobia bacterium]|nr:(E)-4-hydroxy-3-methylbut-2-enyl-diphosphate synthase [Verrucomicrobiota bacterium]MCF7709059.1 (E)-4-hydroxy-3-methylbut-2-enyl-diphosphate synthase [Verrucomicrobiota bacterium]
MRYCHSPYRYSRRRTREVAVGDPDNGGILIGGDNPIVVQSMISVDTLNTAECIDQSIRLAAAGSQLVRITAPTVKAAANLAEIVGGLRERGCRVPVVADIHFKPEAALEAVKWVEKIRINPGNFADKKKFVVKEYTDSEYAAELERVEKRFLPLVDKCNELGRTMRIGANHGSLSDRIMNRYGDTPRGMVESVIEFAAIARRRRFHNIVFSLKSSNPKITVAGYRLLAARLAELGEDWNYPFHLGVTEAGEGDDGRIKNAVGIGALMADGLGDTIRVSLSEDSVREIPVCAGIISEIPRLVNNSYDIAEIEPSYNPFSFERRPSVEAEASRGFKIGGNRAIGVVAERRVFNDFSEKPAAFKDVAPEAVYEELELEEVNPVEGALPISSNKPVTIEDGIGLPAIPAFRLLAARLKKEGLRNPILLKDDLLPRPGSVDPDTSLLCASISLGALLADGIGDAILVRSDRDSVRSQTLAYNILQAVGARIFKTEFISCPSCGRTLFDLQYVIESVKARTRHLKGLKIAVMGCVVNGPGEMADADFGCVGGAPGKVNVYVGKKPVRFNIPQDAAADALEDVIREHGKWIEV